MNPRPLLAVLLLITGPLLAQSPEELQKLRQRFPDADANRDGTITAEEAATYRTKTAPTHGDVHYGEHERQVLDFWAAPSDKPTPVLVFIHGGGFTAGSKDNFSRPMMQRFRAAGISTASISYRYTTQARYPAPMLDGARAIQFLRSKAAEWNIDTKRIAAFGSSAGAGISMWLAFHDDLAQPDSADPVARQSSRLLCAGSIGGQSSYDPLQIKAWLGGRAWEHGAFRPFYGLTTPADLEKPEIRQLARDASVINHLTKDDAPVFFVYSEPEAPLSDDDKPGTGIHHPQFAHILKEKMDALGIEAIYRHTADGQPKPAYNAMDEWLMQKLLAPVK